MRLAIIANEELKGEISSTIINVDCHIDWLNSDEDVPTEADAVIDLLFEQNGYTITNPDSYKLKTVLVNSVNKTIEELSSDSNRINGWPGFLKRTIIEVAGKKNEQVEKIFSFFNKKVEWVPDVKGFISARVISMIINEAYFALEEGVSTKDEIDTAMKLGTNYPYGPFEWSRKIGLKNIATLLNELSKTEIRYQPAGLLIKEAKED